MDRRATEGAYLIDFGGHCIDYRFVRRRRRTIGITIDANALSGAPPLRAPWRGVEAFLRQKERWIKRKLDEWARLPRPAIVRGHSGESLPLFGSPGTLGGRAGRRGGRAAHRQPACRAAPSPAAARDSAVDATRGESADRLAENPGARLADPACRALRSPS